MKTALLICGKCPLNYKDYYESINKTIILPYNPDIFISTWEDIKLDDLTNIFNP